MFYFFIVSGILIQLIILFAFPIYILVKDKRSFTGWRLFIINALWAVSIYYDIWYTLYHPDEWSLNSPGFVLAGYAIIGPLLVWVVQIPIYFLSEFLSWGYTELGNRRSN